MKKNKMAQRVDSGIWEIASGYTTNARPGPKKSLSLLFYSFIYNKPIPEQFEKVAFSISIIYFHNLVQNNVRVADGGLTLFVNMGDWIKNVKEGEKNNKTSQRSQHMVIGHYGHQQNHGHCA